MFRGRCGAPLFFAATLVLAGCFSMSKTDHGARNGTYYRTYQDQIVQCTQAINAGDLALARVHLDQARAVALSAKQQRKVNSLDYLIDGTAALMSGDPDGARLAWAKIDEPHLSREVRHKARLIGMDVPMSTEGQIQ
jgi:outer membrane biogenesis lipoprotein LolB